MQQYISPFNGCNNFEFVVNIFVAYIFEKNRLFQTGQFIKLKKKSIHFIYKLS